jgi:hypothetical protein
MPDLNCCSLPYRNRVLFRLRLSLLPWIAFLSVGANAQSAGCSNTPVQIDETVAAIHMKSSRILDQDLLQLVHLMSRERAAGIPYLQVSVVQVDVDSEGKVTVVKPVSGPQEQTKMLGNWIERASYIPFKENGHAVCAQFLERFVPPSFYESGPELAGKDKFHSLLERCTDLSASGAGPGNLASVCQQAADAGDALLAALFGKDKRLAYVMCATALMRDNRAKEALPYAEKAVATADLGFDDIAGKAAAYGVRGQARGLTGDLHGADEDLHKAEELERATFEVTRTPERRAFDKHALKSMLGFHAEVLTALGKKPEAETLRGEAKTL